MEAARGLASTRAHTKVLYNAKQQASWKRCVCGVLLSYSVRAVLLVPQIELHPASQANYLAGCGTLGDHANEFACQSCNGRAPMPDQQKAYAAFSGSGPWRTAHVPTQANTVTEGAQETWVYTCTAAIRRGGFGRHPHVQEPRRRLGFGNELPSQSCNGRVPMPGQPKTCPVFSASGPSTTANASTQANAVTEDVQETWVYTCTTAIRKTDEDTRIGPPRIQQRFQAVQELVILLAHYYLIQRRLLICKNSRMPHIR